MYQTRFLGGRAGASRHRVLARDPLFPRGCRAPTAILDVGLSALSVAVGRYAPCELTTGSFDIRSAAAPDHCLYAKPDQDVAECGHGWG